MTDTTVHEQAPAPARERARVSKRDWQLERERVFTSAWHAYALCLLAVGIGSLLGAQGLRRQAVTLPQGPGRSVSMALTLPLVKVSHALYIDRPRQELKTAIGRGSDDRINTTISFSAAPPPSFATGGTPHDRPASSRPVPGGGKTVAKGRKRVPAAAPKPKFSPSHQLRIWVAGDSLAQIPGDSLSGALGTHGAATVISVESRVSTGLTRPDVFNWFDRLRQASGELHPNVAVLSFGGDDGHSYMAGVPAGHTIGPLGSASWVAEYRRRAAGAAGELTRADVQVVLLGLPITRGPNWNRNFTVINRILHQVAARDPKHVFYVDAWDMFSDRHGKYAEYLPSAHGHVVQVRSSDGVHYQPPGGDMVARAVLQYLNQTYDLSSWRRAG